MCSTARGAVRNAKQKKTVPAKNSEAIFWRPRFTRPLRTGKRANANFACPEGFFCARRAAPCAGLAAFSKPAAVWPVGFCARCSGIFLPVFRRLVPSLQAACCFCAWSGLRCHCLLLALHALVCAGLSLPCLARRAGVQGGAAARRLCVRLPAVMSAFCGFSLPAFRGVVSRPACSAAFVWAFTPVACLSAVRFVCARIFSLSFAFSCLTFASQKFFHLSLRPRRASTFFRADLQCKCNSNAGSRASPPGPCSSRSTATRSTARTSGA